MTPTALAGLRRESCGRSVATAKRGDQTKLTYSLIPADSMSGAQTSIEFATKAV